MSYYPIIPKPLLGEMAEMIIMKGARKVTKILTSNETVKMTRTTFGKKHRFGLGKKIDLRVTIGIPNYAEREFIKKCKKAGEPFPVKKMIIEWPKNK